MLAPPQLCKPRPPLHNPQQQHISHTPKRVDYAQSRSQQGEEEQRKKRLEVNV